MRGRVVAAILAVCAVAAGCGSSPVGKQGKGWGGLESYEAATAAQGALKQERGDPSSPLYQKLLLVDQVSKSHSPSGHAAWKATLETPENVVNSYCLWVWSAGRDAPFTDNYIYDVDRCPAGNAG
jgi:hypothetical protein